MIDFIIILLTVYITLSLMSLFYVVVLGGVGSHKIGECIVIYAFPFALLYVGVAWLIERWNL